MQSNVCSSAAIRYDNERAALVGVFRLENVEGDQQAQEAVAVVRRRLREANVDEIASGLSEEGGPWALLVRAADRNEQQRLAQLLSEALEEASTLV